VFGKSWGSPAFIDEVYLRNPMEPPDVLGMAQDPGPAPKLPDRKKSKLLLICVTILGIQNGRHADCGLRSVAMCGHVIEYWHSRGTCCLHLQGLLHWPY